MRREAGYCSICWAASVFQLSLQTGDAGESGARGMSEHDKDCGRQFIPDDTVQPMYAGFQDSGQGLDTDIGVLRINVYTDDFEEASKEDRIPNDASSNPQVGFHMHCNQIKY